jgi:hypothetical protein
VHLGIFKRLSTLWQVLTLAQDIEKEKSGAKDSAFSKFKQRYCGFVLRSKVWINVCNVKFQGDRCRKPTELFAPSVAAICYGTIRLA